MTPIRSSPAHLGMPNPLGQTPGALTAQGIEARKAFFSAALNAAQAPTRMAAPPQAARPEPISRTMAANATPSGDAPDTLGRPDALVPTDTLARPGRLLDIRV